MIFFNNKCHLLLRLSDSKIKNRNIFSCHLYNEILTLFNVDYIILSLLNRKVHTNVWYVGWISIFYMMKWIDMCFSLVFLFVVVCCHDIDANTNITNRISFLHRLSLFYVILLIFFLTFFMIIFILLSIVIEDEAIEMFIEKYIKIHWWWTLLFSADAF
jgi:hypothetical protein